MLRKLKKQKHRQGKIFDIQRKVDDVKSEISENIEGDKK